MTMGNLATDMTRLCHEIHGLRIGRSDLRKNLESGAVNLKKEVNRMHAGFQKAHEETARKTKEERTAFLSGLQKTVLRMRTEFSADLAGVHQAWFGPMEVEAGARRKKELPRVAVRDEKGFFPALKAGNKGKNKK